MSATPRTDAIYDLIEHRQFIKVLQEFATMERELAEATRRISDVTRERDEAEMLLRVVLHRHRNGRLPAIPDTFWGNVERIATRNASPLRDALPEAPK